MTLALSLFVLFYILMLAVQQYRPLRAVVKEFYSSGVNPTIT